MKKGIIAATLLLTGAMWPQSEPPQVLRKVAQCLAAKDFEVAKAKQATLAYVVDKKSYAPDTVLYIVSYTKADRSKGLVYTVFLEQRDGKSGFNIQNNATFKRSKDGIDFVNPPLGGIWTQEHLVMAIRQAEREPTFEMPISNMGVPSASGWCESYADKK